ncbi:hypothetical protein BX616_003658 [Lobosporangium transversale]|uniref:Alpha-(1,6)-fucosyltransferase N- and catalytic domain-containing protein n=1 Tax=Lobosporangium transversale TaxID=64571 RepID=A0A1Y2H0T2_9FUNG|nr:hypothetical protein BCR41DRAFT_346665 [Lobosporangium transversale]KAF9898748.1 hypothetical protein BX616_003658 [Lobosporangium transversale]ORZ27333.1 hypothetical protein BCR41DRAFT_346665 [Lobosporangium transversale]|eukprot:XP_021885060.1 hypothetical protein BCR41DRAFT_346665 [Lobosporangium transversale]
MAEAMDHQLTILRRGMIIACTVTVLIIGLVTYQLHTHITKLITFPIHRNHIRVINEWPLCPIQKNTNDICIHRQANQTQIEVICGKINATTTSTTTTTTISLGSDCKERDYDLIVVPKELMQDVSDHVKRIMIVQGDGKNFGQELDGFVQTRSQWVIDPFGGDGFEILKTFKEDKERMSLQAQLDRLQHRCTNFFYGIINRSGFGSVWHTAGLGLAWTLYYNMTLFIQLDEHLQPKPSFQGFIPTTTCSYSDLEAAFTTLPPETDFSKWTDSTVNFKSLTDDVGPLGDKRELIIPTFNHRGHFWWRSVLTYYVIRPNAQTREWIRGLQQQQGEGLQEHDRATTVMLRTRDCISIHVRHGDKGTESRLIPFYRYMTKAYEIHERTGVSNIYLMTDDQKVIEATKNYPTFKIYYQIMPRTNRGWEKDVTSGKVSREDQAKMFLKDLYSTTQCRHTIVTYSSNVGRLIGEIRMATEYEAPDVFSMDAVWVMEP